MNFLGKMRLWLVGVALLGGALLPSSIRAKGEEEGAGLDQILNLDQLDFGSLLSSGGGGGEFKIDEQMAGRVRALIRHFKQDDPIGIPEGLGLEGVIQEPIQIPNLEQTFSGTRMKFNDLKLYGLTKFRLEHVRVKASELKIGVGLSIDEIFVNGLYQMSSWFTKARGNFSVTITNVSTEAEVSFRVDEEGILQVQEVPMDVKFGDIKMNFENLGFLGSIFQGMVNSVGGFLFDSIKPVVLQDAETKVRGELNKQARSVPQQFPNSINPLDTVLIAARDLIREKGLDPFPFPEEALGRLSYGALRVKEGALYGLSTIHRTGPIVLAFEQNVARVLVSFGAKDLKGFLRWRLAFLRGLLAKEGKLEFQVEWFSAEVQVSQPANLDFPATIDKIDLEVGNLAVLSEGMGTLDYLLEAGANILPNLLRKEIVDLLEEPMREFVEAEVQRMVQLERMIEERLPPQGEE